MTHFYLHLYSQYNVWDFLANVIPKPWGLAIVTYCKAFSWCNIQYHIMSLFLFPLDFFWLYLNWFWDTWSCHWINSIVPLYHFVILHKNLRFCSLSWAPVEQLSLFCHLRDFFTHQNFKIPEFFPDRLHLIIPLILFSYFHFP